MDSKELENEVQSDFQVQCTCSSRGSGRSIRSLVDLSWQSVSKITLDLPWRARGMATGGREKVIKMIEEEREGEKRKVIGNICYNDKLGQVESATMTSRIRETETADRWREIWRD